MKLRETIRRVQLLEQSAADKAGARFLLLDEGQLTGPKAGEYVTKMANQILKDIVPEIIEAAKIGKELLSEVIP
jgi:hypothetical protein